MSVIEESDAVIHAAIEQLVEEFGRTGFFRLTEPDPGRKVEIAKDIATLRASLNPECTCKK